MFSKTALFPTICLVIFCLGWARLRKASSCSWLNPQFCDDEPGPVSAIYFVHMRKSGGSSVAEMIKNWMIDQRCVNSTWASENNNMIRYGWSRGRSFQKNVDPATIPAVGAETCPHFTLLHDEVDCVNGVELLASATSRVLPPLSTAAPRALVRGQQQPRMVYFTTLRDPIERIGSQAFYYNGVGTETIKVTARSMCNNVKDGVGLCKQRPENLVCPCVEKAKVVAMTQLKSEPQMWFKWFNNISPTNWQSDRYARNYYIRRLMGVPRLDVAKPGPAPLGGCVHNPLKCPHIPAARTGAQALRTYGHHIYCHSDRTEPLEAVDWDAALQRAKDVLRDHFELVITERMSGDAAKVVLQRVFGPDFLSAQAQTSVLRVNNQDAISFNTSRSQTGKGSAAAESRSYTSFMPESVVAYLQKENAADIELYRYAVELFEARATATKARA